MQEQTGLAPIKSFLAFVEERDGRWEAICLDFDLAVQGRSFDEVTDKIRDQVRLFLDGVRDLPPADQARLLRRRVPPSLQLRLLLSVFWSVLRGRRDGGREEYILRLPTGFAAA
ncbi:MAG: hypothetical protein ACHQIO_15175 [Nevskiales bacterium]